MLLRFHFLGKMKQKILSQNRTHVRFYSSLRQQGRLLKQLVEKIENVVMGKFASDHPLSSLDIQFQTWIMESPKNLSQIEYKSSGKLN